MGTCRPMTNEQPTSGPDGPTATEPDEHEDPTEIADDGMAPIITNTGADETLDDDADAATG